MKSIIHTAIFTLFAMSIFGQSSLKEKYNEEVYKVVEQMPRFPGCEDIEGSNADKKKCAEEKMMKYIYDNQTYPEEAFDNEVEGRVILQFLVQKDGTLSDIIIARNPGYGLGEAAAELIEQMNTDGKTWRPGHHGGKPLLVLYTLPILYRLEDFE